MSTKKTKWQRQILAVVTALLEGASKVEQTTGTLYRPGYKGNESAGYEPEAPQACALGAIYIDGKNVARIRGITYNKLYKEHPVLKTATPADSNGWEGGIELAEHIITLNDSEGLSFKQIVSYLRKLARRKGPPTTYRWPSHVA